jgi:hypothetical protein
VVTVDVFVGPGVSVNVGVAGVAPVGVTVEVTVVGVTVGVLVAPPGEVLKIIGAIHSARSVAGGPEERIVRINRIS